jgi:drug/metabolite transporter (DMT)-like permease
VLLLQSCQPLLVMIWAFAWFQERPSGWQLGAVAMSLAGVAVVAAHGSLDALLALRFYRADLWILGSAVIYGVYIVLLRLRPNVHPLSFMQAMMGIGVCMVAPFYLRELSNGARMTDDWGNFAGIAYMAVLPSFVSYLFFNRGVQLIGSTRAGQSTHLMPIAGSVMAVMFLGESLHVYHLVGAVLIGTGIVLAQLKSTVRGRRGNDPVIPVHAVRHPRARHGDQSRHCAGTGPHDEHGMTGRVVVSSEVRE